MSSLPWCFLRLCFLLRSPFEAQGMSEDSGPGDNAL
jgi:hypothetical protein